MKGRRAGKPPSPNRAALLTEAQVRDPVVRWAKRNGIYHKRMHFGRGAAAGWPDDLFLLSPVVFNGGLGWERTPIGGPRSLWVEFKATGKEATPLQANVHKAMREYGQNVYVFNDSDAAIACLTSYLGASAVEG